MKKTLILTFISLFYFLLYTNVHAHKPYNELEVSNVNLKNYPKKISHHGPDIEITIGDLHGNAQKLLYFLISNDVIRINPQDYQRFIAIYKKSPKDLSHKDIGLFHAIINSATINAEHKLRFLGDDLCDRGMNDYYTLYIYKKLDQANVWFEVVLSNHGNFFLSAYERPEKSFSYNPYGEGKHEDIVQSMLNLGKLIDYRLVDKQEIIDLIQGNYLKHVVFPGVTFNKAKNEVTIYSHAPIDLNIISALAKELNVIYEDGSLEQLRSSFTRINKQIQEWIVSNTFTENYKRLNNAHIESSSASPIRQILWNRDYTILDRNDSPSGKSYTVNYVHGHDSSANVFDLDNLFGKGANNDRGPFAIHISHE
jgi:hypothetical protein